MLLPILIIIIIIIIIISLKHKCPNLFYMDDRKLCDKNDQEQASGELKIVKQFSDDIGKECG